VAVFGADAAPIADHRFLDLFIPEYGTDRTGIDTESAANTFGGIEIHSATVALLKSVRRTHQFTGGIFACTTDNDDKPSFYAACRSHSNSAICQSGLARQAGACKHAALASNAFLVVDDGEFFHRCSDRLFDYGLDAECESSSNTRTEKIPFSLYSDGYAFSYTVTQCPDLLSASADRPILLFFAVLPGHVQIIIRRIIFCQESL